MEAKEKMQEELLWATAKKRVGFKKSIITYVIVNTFLWTIWFLTDREDDNSLIPWPIWSTIGWGIGLVFQYMNAYVFNNKMDSIEKEYEKLKNTKK